MSYRPFPPGPRSHSRPEQNPGTAGQSPSRPFARLNQPGQPPARTPSGPFLGHSYGNGPVASSVRSASAQSTPCRAYDRAGYSGLYDDEISPGSKPHPPPLASRAQLASIAPWMDTEDTFHSSDGDQNFYIPASPSRPERQPPTGAPVPGSLSPWPPRLAPQTTGPAQAFPVPPSNGTVAANTHPSRFDGSFFDEADTDDQAAQTPSAPDDDPVSYSDEPRRPSAASATTINSAGSRSSARAYQKRLKDFFGSELPDSLGQPRDDRGVTFTDTFAQPRTHSVVNSSCSSRPASPRTVERSERSATDRPSALNVSQLSLRRDGRRSAETSRKPGSLASLVSLAPGHRHSRSKDESRLAYLAAEAMRPKTARERDRDRNRDRRPGRLSDTPPGPSPAHSSTFPAKREQNPGDVRWGSTGSTAGLTVPAHGPRRSLFDKIRRRETREVSSSKEHKESDPKPVHRLPFMSKRPSEARSDPSVPDGNFHFLDTDLSNVDDIVGTRLKPAVQLAPSRNPSTVPSSVKSPGILDGAVAWAAPDSWSVKIDGHVQEPDIDPADLFSDGVTDNGIDGNEVWRFRVFRPDSTFVTISIPVKTTVKDVIQMFVRKTMLNEDPTKFQLVIRKSGFSKLLDEKECPLVLQKRLLKQAGYESSDRNEDVSREDSFYLCRFIFIPFDCSGFSGIDNEPSLEGRIRAGTFDLRGCDLLTIPLALYTKASDIVKLDLSKNLSIKVPADFMETCLRLRELRLVGCELKRVPPSIFLASKIIKLDLSNNRIVAIFDDILRLRDMIDLKLADNRLTTIPSPFFAFSKLQRLDLRGNNIENLPPLVGLSRLEDLDLSYNKLAKIDPLFSIPNITRLWLAGNNLSEWGIAGIEALVNLKELDISDNRIEYIDVVSNLEKLEIFTASRNKVASVKACFPRLRQIEMKGNPLIKFELSGPCPYLKRVNVSNGNLASLDDSIFRNASGIVELIVESNQLATISSNVKLLQQLQVLRLGRNMLTSLPPDIGFVPELRELSVWSNYLDRLPAEIWALGKLKILNAASNSLNRFPRPNQRILDRFNGDDSSSLANSLEKLILADNNITEASFDVISLFTQTRVLNMSYNNLFDIPFRAFAKWNQLAELYLSGNHLSTLPFDEMDDVSSLRVLFLNKNKFQVLPAEVGKVSKLSMIDAGSNLLRYDVNNWPYDWNWNWNQKLVYLNLSGNKRLEIKPLSQPRQGSDKGPSDLTDFTTLRQLRVLGLMDITLMVQTLPDQTEDRRVRTAGSIIGSLPYALADWLGRDWTEHVTADTLRMADPDGRLNTFDLVVPRFRGREDACVVAMFEGTNEGSADGRGGARLAKYLHENFSMHLSDEMDRLRTRELPVDALRRAFLGLNRSLAKDVGAKVGTSAGPKAGDLTTTSALPVVLSPEDGAAGAMASVVFIDDDRLSLAHVGTIQVMVVHSDGSYTIITSDHTTSNHEERSRVRDSGGFLARDGSIDTVSSVTRQFGRFQSAPAISCCPTTLTTALGDHDEIVVISNHTLWDWVPPQLVADTAKACQGDGRDMSGVVQKLRDLAIAFGGRDQLMVMAVGVGQTRRKERTRLIRTQSLGRPEIGSNGTGQASRFDRLGSEALAPTDEVSLVFTDIKNSTLLWDQHPEAMHAAIRMHNDVMRRFLRLHGGYEVKTEGDAFMVAFSSVTSALLWCLTVQENLLGIAWPEEILRTEYGREVLSDEQQADLEEVENMHQKGADWTIEDAFEAGISAAVKAGSTEKTDKTPLSFIRAWLQDPPARPSGTIYRGLSVRMGIHFGTPVCETDPVTHRMDYFGPMVNRTARVSSVADGGQISVSSDFLSEAHRWFLGYVESEKARKDTDTGVRPKLSATAQYLYDSIDPLAAQIRREIAGLLKIGFDIAVLGERRLKGLENPEFIYLMYPSRLAGRLTYRPSSGRPAPVRVDPARGLALVNFELVAALHDIASRLERVGREHGFTTFPVGPRVVRRRKRHTVTSSISATPSTPIGLESGSSQDPVGTAIEDINAMFLAFVRANVATVTPQQMAVLLEQIVGRVETAILGLEVRCTEAGELMGGSLSDVIERRSGTRLNPAYVPGGRPLEVPE